MENALIWEELDNKWMNNFYFFLYDGKWFGGNEWSKMKELKMLGVGVQALFDIR